MLILVASLLLLYPGLAGAAVVSTTGTVTEEASPYPAEDDATIFVFAERSQVAFVATQPLDFGAIAPGTQVNSHYVQYDPVTPSLMVGTGSVTFDGPILGVITQTARLNKDLSPDVAATSDEYFGLATALGAYPAGQDPSARGLGSPEDDLLVVIGSNTLTIESLEIPSGSGGNLDGFRVLTAPPPPTVPLLPGWTWLMALLVMTGSLAWSARR